MADTGADAAHRYRDHLKAKARRLGEGEDAKSVDASDFTPAEKLYAGVKTGMRPISRQARADGGAVAGKCAGGRADRPGRAKGGGLGESYVNRDAKAADEDREGHYPNGGMKKGGRTHRAEGGYLPREEGPSETRALKGKTGSSAVETGGRPAAEDGRHGRASGGRAARLAGGPLSTPLSEGMGGQGRMNFNYGPQQSAASKLGIKSGGYVGRERAHQRYGAGPGHEEHHPGIGKAYGGDVYGRSPENKQFDEDARASDPAWMQERRPPAPSKPRQKRAAGGTAAEPPAPIMAPPLSKLKGRYSRPISRGRANGGAAPGPAEGSITDIAPDTTASAAPGPAESSYAGPRYNRMAVQSAIDSSNRRGRKIGGKEARLIHAVLKGHQRGDYAGGGEVAEKALAAHHAEHKAMAKGRASGGITDDPPSYGRAQARQDRAAAIAQKAAFRAAGKSKASGGKAGHGPDCDCPRCASRKAKGGLLSAFGAMSKADGGRAAHARGGKAGKGTKINIIIAPGGMNPQTPPGAGGLPPNLALKPPPAAPMPMPAPPGGAPGAAPMPMPIPIPMGGGMPGAGMAGGATPPRARGGRAPRVGGNPLAGAGSGLGRLQKAHGLR